MRETAQNLARKLAAEVREQIRADRERASAQVAPLLDYIAEHLLDSDLQVADLRRFGQTRDKNISTRFDDEVGQAPRAYITRRRMEIATRILVESDLSVSGIGFAVGYTSGNSFGRAFKRWSDGQSPGAFREAQGRSPGLDRRERPGCRRSPSCWTCSGWRRRSRWRSRVRSRRTTP